MIWHAGPPLPAPVTNNAVAAVELGKERIVILGQLADEVDPTDLQVGQEMEVTLGTLYEDDENEYLVWKWKPVAA